MIRDIKRYGIVVALWWQMEQFAGKLWQRFTDENGHGRFEHQLDLFCAWTYARRKQAERRAYERKYGEKL